MGGITSVHLSASPLTLPGSMWRLSPHRGGQKSSTAKFRVPCFLIWRSAPWLRPSGCRERGACTERRCSPFASIFGSESNKNRTEARGGGEGGEEGGGEGGAFSFILETGCLLDGVPTGLLMIHHVRVLNTLCKCFCSNTETVGCNLPNPSANYLIFQVTVKRVR